MNVFWYLFNWWLTLSYTDVAAITWWKAGENWIITFLYLLLTSTILLLGYFGGLSLFNLVSWAVKKFLYPRIKKGSGFKKTRIVKFVLGCYAWFKKTRVLRFILACYSWRLKVSEKISTKWGKKIAGAMGKHKYWTLFILNLVPYVFYVSTATIIAAKLKRISFGILAILAGNAVKVFYVVGLVYTSPIWLSWFRYMIGKFF